MSAFFRRACEAAGIGKASSLAITNKPAARRLNLINPSQTLHCVMASGVPNYLTTDTGWATAGLASTVTSCRSLPHVRSEGVNRRLRAFSTWRRHADEVFVKINGERHYLWRAVDHELMGPDR